jgi:membrane protease YdiL (CAAX protease family)
VDDFSAISAFPCSFLHSVDLGVGRDTGETPVPHRLPNGRGSVWTAILMASTSRHSPRPPDPDLRALLGGPIDRKVVTLLVLAAVVLTFASYYGTYGQLSAVMRWVMECAGVDDAKGRLDAVFVSHPRRRLWALEVWALTRFLYWAVVPAIVIRLVFRERLADYGLKLSGWARKLWVYAGALAVVLPLVWIFGGTASFQKTYPFYKQAGDSWFDLLAWEAGYAMQFFAVEFFFRGVLIHGLKHRFGVYAVLIQTVPYCMIHFGKPLPETLGAIIAGVALGMMSLWTHSIWLGFLVHVTVAVSMDLVAMAHRGALGGLTG